MGFDDLKNEIEKMFPNAKKDDDLGKYAVLKYPKYFSMMKMRVFRYDLPDYGSIMVMNTSMMGLMKLNTLSFTPNEGKDVPFLLIDTMSMMKKRLAYVEFYNTTEKDFPSLYALKKKYQDISDYQEKPAWYVKERMEGSLIKCRIKKDEEGLMDMVLYALSLYKNEIDKADVDIDNVKRLSSFSDRMIKEGNPSSSTLQKVLGREQAEDFFRKIVMRLK